MSELYFFSCFSCFFYVSTYQDLLLGYHLLGPQNFPDCTSFLYINYKYIYTYIYNYISLLYSNISKLVNGDAFVFEDKSMEIINILCCKSKILVWWSCALVPLKYSFILRIIGARTDIRQWLYLLLNVINTLQINWSKTEGVIVHCLHSYIKPSFLYMNNPLVHNAEPVLLHLSCLVFSFCCQFTLNPSSS